MLLLAPCKVLRTHTCLLESTVEENINLNKRHGKQKRSFLL